MIALAVLIACSSPGPSAPPAWNDARPTQLKRYDVAIELVPEPPPMGELFDVRAIVTAGGQPIEDGAVTLNAMMPQHAHGMQTDPKPDPGVCEGTVCKRPGGVYTTKGFAFHMGGEWTITVQIDGAEGPDSTSFVYRMPG